MQNTPKQTSSPMPIICYIVNAACVTEIITFSRKNTFNHFVCIHCNSQRVKHERRCCLEVKTNKLQFCRSCTHTVLCPIALWCRAAAVTLWAHEVQTKLWCGRRELSVVWLSHWTCELWQVWFVKDGNCVLGAYFWKQKVLVFIECMSSWLLLI